MKTTKADRADTREQAEIGLVSTVTNQYLLALLDDADRAEELMNALDMKWECMCEDDYPCPICEAWKHE
jgi:hypothetical protein